MRPLVARLMRALAVATCVSGLLTGATSPAVASTSDGPAVTEGTPTLLTPTSTGATRFGTSVFVNGGGTYREAFLRQQRTYGRPGAVRMFFPGLPDSWATINERVGKAPVIVSFKAPPAEVVAGLHDREFRQWFAAAPRDRVSWWSYWHEPEVAVARERLDAEIYKLAWQRLAALAETAGNPRLLATLTLMCWTTEPKSGRNWRDYYAGDAVIDVLAFDCYNAGYRYGRYRAPADLFAAASDIAQSIGKPWGVAELGSVVVSGDRGRGRAAWLHRSARYLRNHDASFCTYFDSDVDVDYRLHDRGSRRAWRAVVRSQWG